MCLLSLLHPEQRPYIQVTKHRKYILFYNLHTFSKEIELTNSSYQDLSGCFSTLSHLLYVGGLCGITPDAFVQ